MGDNAQQNIWILEFLIRQPVEDNTLNRLILALSHPISDHRLIKTLLIRKISSQCAISESILESIELIEEIDHLNGTKPLDSMKDAYLAVATHCVVRFLKENSNNWSEYSTAVDRIRRGGVHGWIKDLMTQLEMADVVLDSISLRDTETDAINAVGAFVVQVREDMGPSFLEMVAERISDGCVDNSVIATKNYDQVLTPEYRKVKEGLKSSISDLNDVVKDPLPDALRMAATISANTEPQVRNIAESAGVHDELEINRCDRTAVQKKCDVAVASRLNLMERNNTAHTFEWDDEVESSSRGCSYRPHLPTPRNRIVTPLRRQEIQNIFGRRQKKRWSALEEQTLRVAVNEFGRGNWKIILDNYHHIFEERTTVDLKDKWRNMTR